MEKKLIEDMIDYYVKLKIKPLLNFYIAFSLALVCIALSISLWGLDKENKVLEQKLDNISVSIERNVVEINVQQQQINALKEQVSRSTPVSRGGERRFIASAYTANDPGCNRITATGTSVKEGRTISVDPSVIPLGSRVEIITDYPGMSGIYIAEDTGGAIKGNKIDIFMESRKEALEFGRRTIVVRVLKENS